MTHTLVLANAIRFAAVLSSLAAICQSIVPAAHGAFIDLLLSLTCHSDGLGFLWFRVLDGSAGLLHPFKTVCEFATS